MLVKGSDIVMHHGHGVLRRIVDKRQRGEAIGVTSIVDLGAGVHGVPVVVVHQVFLKRGQPSPTLSAVSVRETSSEIPPSRLVSQPSRSGSSNALDRFSGLSPK